MTHLPPYLRNLPYSRASESEIRFNIPPLNRAELLALRTALLIAKDQVDFDSRLYAEPGARDELKALHGRIEKLYQVASNAEETATPA